MNTRAILPALACTLIWGAMPAWAQAFSSGSTGADNALNVTVDTTLDVPPSGIFNFTTVTIAPSRTLRFRRNAANTPVHVLATGNINIAGSVNVDGSAGNGVVGGIAAPGGFDGGSPGSTGVPPGNGYGPGAGKSGNPNTTAEGAGGGSFSTVGGGQSLNKGAIYGNALLIPMVGGSGGGGSVGTPGSGGGSGGGAILFASSTRIDVGGFIGARGGNGSSGAGNAGSGGAVRLVAPIVAGTGGIGVDGPFGAGSGRIRVDAMDRSGVGINMTPASVVSVGSLMLVFPSPLPRLDVLEAAGTTVTENSGPVLVLLPFGSNPNQTVKVQARDFNAEVPITLVLTPDHGPSVTYTGKIDNGPGKNPASATFNVVLPVNEQTAVHVYSK